MSAEDRKRPRDADKPLQNDLGTLPPMKPVSDAVFSLSDADSTSALPCNIVQLGRLSRGACIRRVGAAAWHLCSAEAPAESGPNRPVVRCGQACWGCALPRWCRHQRN